MKQLDESNIEKNISTKSVALEVDKKSEDSSDGDSELGSDLDLDSFEKSLRKEYGNSVVHST